MLKSKNNLLKFFRKPVIIYLLISLFIITVWFRKGLFYGGGDIGMPLYNVQLQAEIATQTWWEQHGPGFNYPAVTASFPFYAVFTAFQFIGFSPFMVQAFFFFLVFYFSLTGAYKLTTAISRKSVTDVKKLKLLAFVTSMLYVFNPYVMFNVWHRFAHTSMVLFAYLPWTIYFLHKGLVEKKLKYAVFLSLSSMLGAYSFGTPSFLATWLFVVFAFSLYFMIFDSSKRYFQYNISFLFIFGLIFVGLNYWWLSPFFTSASAALSVATTPDGNINSLKGVSIYYKLPYALRGINSFFLDVQKDWGNIFNLSVFRLISWTGLSFLIASLFKKDKPNHYYFFLVILLLVIFISKGNGYPFGGLILLGFKFIPQLGVFRNPFEKFGILYPMFFSYLSAEGFVMVYEKIKFGKFRFVKNLIIIFLLAFIAVYNWPIWTGNIFGGLHRTNLVSVPKEYSEAQKWFEDLDDPNLRILHLPLALGDGTTYNWEYKYNGLESSQLFFPGSSISHFLGSQQVDNQLRDLALSINQNDQEMFEMFCNKFGIKYIVVHADVDYSSYPKDTLENTTHFLDSLPYIHKTRSIGFLTIYAIDQNKIDNQRITLSTNLVGINTFSYADDDIFKLYSDSNFVALSESANEDVFSGQLYVPDSKLLYPLAQITNERAVDELVFIRFTPDNTLYPLIRLKEFFSKIQLTDNQLFDNDLILVSKRLIEIYTMINNGTEENMIMDSITRYSDYLYSLFPQLKTKAIQDSNSHNYDSIIKVQTMFFRHLAILDELIKQEDGRNLQSGLVDVRNDLSQILKESGLMWMFETSDQANNGVIYRFNVDEEGLYNLVLNNDTWSEISKNITTNFYLDADNINVDWSENNSFLISQKFKLSKGVHEVFVAYQPIDVLPKNDESFTLSVKDGEVDKVFDFVDVNTQSDYRISFDYRIEKGSGPVFNMYNHFLDTDTLPDVPSYKHEIFQDNYDYGWKNYSQTFRLDPFVRKVTAQFKVKPWNDCRTIFWHKQKVCKDFEFAKRYNRESEVEFRNIQIQKYPLDGVMLLRHNFDAVKKPDAISFEKINATKYKIYPQKTQKSLLIFKETYHDGWNLEDGDGNVVNAKHVLVDFYANGWIVDKIDNPLFVVFEPQKRIFNGLYVGMVMTFFAILIYVFSKKYER